MYILKLRNAIIFHCAAQKSLWRKVTGTSAQITERSLKNLLTKIFAGQEMCFYAKENAKKGKTKLIP